MFGDSGALAINPVSIRAWATIRSRIRAGDRAGHAATILVIHPEVPAKTLDEFIGSPRTARQDELRLGRAGSIHHLTFAIFAERAGIDLLHVPYRGGSRW